jgi:hypothetical protein
MTVGLQRLQWLVVTLTIITTLALSPAEAQTRYRNRPPTISGTPPTTITAGGTYTFTPTATDPEGRLLTFLINNRPAWASFSRTNGQLTGSPQTAGTYSNIAIGVSDGRKIAWLPAFNITVTAAAGNQAPTISGTPSTAAKPGVQYAFQPTASDPNGDPLTFTIANRPTWATFNVSTGALTGTPATTSVGSWTNIVISVSDGKLKASLPAFAITVAAANTPPTISGTPPTTATVGTAYAFTPSASDANGDALTFSISNLPGWATFSASTGRLQGTPAATNVGSFGNIVIRVSDGQSTTSLPAFAIQVNAATSTNAAPTISGTPPSTATVGVGYAFQPSASDANGDLLTFSIANLPRWATFSTSTGRLQGTPAAADVGGYTNIVIGVNDGKTTTSLPAFAINVNAAPTATGSATLSWVPPTQNTDGSTLTNLAGYKVYWGTTQGTYPNSVTLNNPGLASYVVGNLAPGTYFFVVTSVNTTGSESVRSNAASKTIP